MKIIRNSILPPKGFAAINLFGVLLARRTARITSTTLQHEEIHTMQMKEMLYVFFYLWYVAEWLVRLAVHRNAHRAYRTISFEQEAYDCERDATYRHWRRPYCWTKYLSRKWNT